MDAGGRVTQDAQTEGSGERVETATSKRLKPLSPTLSHKWEREQFVHSQGNSFTS